MKKLLLFMMIPACLSCTKHAAQVPLPQDTIPPFDTTAYLKKMEGLFDSIYNEECKRIGWHSKDKSVIAWMCAFEQTGLPLTEEQIAYWDSVNEFYDGVLIRDAERDLDTIINHMRYHFIPEP